MSDQLFPTSELAQVTLALKDGTHGTHERIRNGVPFLSAKNISDSGTVEFDDSDEKISEVEYQKLHNSFKLVAGDVLLTVVGSLGRRAIYSGEKVTFQRSVAYVRPDPKAINERFLFHYFGHPEFGAQLARRSNATAQAGLYLGELAKTTVPTPGLAEQKHIAQILDTIDTAIHETEALIAKLKAVKQGLLHDLLTRGIAANGQLRPPQSEAPHLYKQSPLGWIPQEWEPVQLGKLAALQRGYDIVEANLKLGPYPVISSSGIVGFHSVATSRGPNVVVGRKGSIGTVHYVETDFWAHDTSLFVTNFFGNDRQFVFHLFCHLRLGDYGTKSGSPSLNRNDIHPLWVGRPDLNEQQEIVERLTSHSTIETQTKQEFEKLKSLKIALMDDLLTGRVRVTPLLTHPEPAHA